MDVRKLTQKARMNNALQGDIGEVRDWQGNGIEGDARGETGTEGESLKSG